MSSQVDNSEEDSLDEANRLIAAMEFEQKRDEPSEGDDNDILATTTTTKNGYNKIKSRMALNKITVNKQYTPNAISSKVYCTAGYYIILHLLIIYSVIISTYVLIEKNNYSSNTAAGFTEVTENHSNFTAAPTQLPIVIPSNNPSYNPTIRPTELPTYEYDLYRNYIGDYKISVQNKSHGAWLLCDGQFVDSQDYPELFSIIGHSFGSFPNYPSLFALPDAKDRVIGASGDKYKIGSMIGQETLTLTEKNIPSHTHYMAFKGGCANQNGYSTSQPYLANSCDINSNWGSMSYILKTTTAAPNAYPTSAVGNQQSFNLAQPTVIVGNLFIFSGQY